MTYGIFDKEELKFEKQLEALLTEAPPKRKPGHWSDIYARAGWDDTPNTPVTPEKPKDDTESVPVIPTDDDEGNNVPVVPPPVGLRKTPPKVKPVVVKPEEKPAKVPPVRYNPLSGKKIGGPSVKPSLKAPPSHNLIKAPADKKLLPKVEPPSGKKIVYDPLANKPTGSKKIVKPVSKLLPPTPNKQLQLAQKQADDIVKKLSQATGKERLRLTTQLKQIANNNPKLKYNKQLLLPEPEGKVVSKGKVTDVIPDTPVSTSSNPELDNAKKLLKTLKPGTERYKLIQKQVQALSGNAIDLDAEANRAKAQASSNAIQKAEQEALQKRQEKQKLQQQAAAAAEEKRKAKELAQAKAKAEAEAKLKAKELKPKELKPKPASVVEPVATEPVKPKVVEPEQPKVVEPEKPVKTQSSGIGQGVKSAPEIKVTTGDSIEAVAKRAGFTGANAIDDFKEAQKLMGGGKITQATGKTSGKLIDVVHPNQKYISANQLEDWFQKNRGIGYSEFKTAEKVKNSAKYDKLSKKAQIDIDNRIRQGQGIEKVNPDEVLGKKPIAVGKQVSHKPSNAYRLRQALKSPGKFLMSTKGDILTTVVVAAASAYGSGKWIRNIETEQERYRVEDERKRKAFEADPANKGKKYIKNALHMLSPMQYVGGAGNFAMYKDPDEKAWGGLAQRGGAAKWTGAAAAAEMLTMDEVITRTMPESTAENEADIIKSLANVKLGEVTDFQDPTNKQEFDKWVKNNIVTIVMPDGTMRRVNDWGLGEVGEDGSKPWFGRGGTVWQMGQGDHRRTGAEAFKASLQPGTMIQVIPQVDENGNAIPLNQQTKQMSTTLINPESEWTGEFKDIYHYVSDKEERGGRIKIEGKEMYIPTKEELQPFLLNHMEELIPSDWYLGYKDPTEWDTLTDREKEVSNMGLRKRPTTPEGWLAQKGFEGKTAQRFDSFMHAGPDMNDQELITWWKEYRTKHKIKKPDGGLLSGDTLDPFLDPIGRATGLWNTGERDDEMTHTRDDAAGEVTDDEWGKIKPSKVSTDTTGVLSKPVVPLDPRVQNVMKNSYKQGTEGFPTSFGEYETLMQELSKESGVPIQMLRALGKRESGIHAKSNGKLSGWNPVGDTNKGTGAALGIFHVRSSKDGAAVEEYNDQNGTNYDWKDTASNPRLAATIGAWYFKYWLDQTGGDPIQAYMHYNGGPGGNLSPLARANAEKYAKDLDYFQESKFIKKSAILEGMSKVNI